LPAIKNPKNRKVSGARVHFFSAQKLEQAPADGCGACFYPSNFQRLVLSSPTAGSDAWCAYIL
jgi:hypothetical protein